MAGTRTGRSELAPQARSERRKTSSECFALPRMSTSVRYYDQPFHQKKSPHPNGWGDFFFVAKKTNRQRELLPERTQNKSDQLSALAKRLKALDYPLIVLCPARERVNTRYLASTSELNIQIASGKIQLTIQVPSRNP
jgi:hypothetical protein